MHIAHRPGPAVQPIQLNPAYVEQWNYIQAYLKRSDAEGDEASLRAAAKVLPQDLVTSSYVDLIRTTFLLKIVPALKQVTPSASNYVGICENLRDGLARYEKCFAKLGLETVNIRRAFNALVRVQLDTTAWKDPINEWVTEVLLSGNENLLVHVHQTVSAIGIASAFEEQFQVALGRLLTSEIESAHAKDWTESHLESVIATTLQTPRRLLQLLGIVVPDEQLDVLARRALAELRIAEMFDIIVDYPASIAALEDLKQCLGSTTMRAKLVESYQNACQTRLLHPGANTPDIITVYIATIKVFLLLDPPGVLLDRVARPIRKYLRERTDTIRSIMSSLLGEVDNELAQELAASIDVSADVLDEDDPNWTPDPVDAAPDYMKNKASDIIGSLITIYENKDVFVRELQTLLADRLFAVTNYNIDQELRNLEMLKLRFGDSMMSVCDVMLKDVSDSKRIDAQVHEVKPEIPGYVKADNILHCTIVSRLYWPQLSKYQTQSSEGLKLPAALDGMFKEYSAEFAKLKAQRSLKFQKEMGHVRVELALQDRNFDMLVSPTHAALISLFDEDDGQSILSLQEISDKLGLPLPETRKNIAFWVAQQVLTASMTEGQITYSVMEALHNNAAGSAETVAPLLPELPMNDPAAEGAPIEEIDDMHTYWQFIVGMLTNVGPLPADRIHSMLGMFAPGYDRSRDQLVAFLERQLRAGEVDLKGGQYKLSDRRSF